MRLDAMGMHRPSWLGEQVAEGRQEKGTFLGLLHS